MFLTFPQLFFWLAFLRDLKFCKAMHLHTAQAHFVPAFSTWLDVANMRLIKRIEKSFEVDQCLASQVLETQDLTF